MWAKAATLSTHTCARTRAREIISGRAGLRAADDVANCGSQFWNWPIVSRALSLPCRDQPGLGVLLASTGECTAGHIAAARMVLLATKLCAPIQITLHDDRARLRLAASSISERVASAMSLFDR